MTEMLKKIRIILFSFLIGIFALCTLPSEGLSAEQFDQSCYLANLGEIKITVRGVIVECDVPPVIKDGRTLIPVRAVMLGLGAEVKWDELARTVTVTRSGKTVTLNLMSGDAFVNGRKVELDVPAQIIKNRTFVPLRFIAESLGEKVEYVEQTGEINIG